MSKLSERGHLNFDCNALKMSAEFAVSFKKNYLTRLSFKI